MLVGKSSSSCSLETVVALTVSFTVIIVVGFEPDCRSYYGTYAYSSSYTMPSIENSLPFCLVLELCRFRSCSKSKLRPTSVFCFFGNRCKPSS